MRRAATLLVTDVDALAQVRVCVKTGTVTENRILMWGHAHPRWTALLWLGGPIVWFLGTSAHGRRFRIELPCQPSVVKQFTAGRRAALTIFWTGTFWGAYEIIANHPTIVSPIPLALGFAAWVFNGWRNGIGIYLDERRDAIVLTRIHLQFSSAYVLVRQRRGLGSVGA